MACDSNDHFLYYFNGPQEFKFTENYFSSQGIFNFSEVEHNSKLSIEEYTVVQYNVTRERNINIRD